MCHIFAHLLQTKLHVLFFFAIGTLSAKLGVPNQPHQRKDHSHPLDSLTMGTLSAKPGVPNQPLQRAARWKDHSHPATREKERSHPNTPLPTHVNSERLPQDVATCCLHMYMNGMCSHDCHDDPEVAYSKDLPQDTHQLGNQVRHCLRMYANGLCSDDCHDTPEELPVNLSFALYNHSTPGSVPTGYELWTECRVSTLGYREPPRSANLASVLNLFSVALMLSLLTALK